jgi:hypothetical protein
MAYPHGVNGVIAGELSPVTSLDALLNRSGTTHFSVSKPLRPKDHRMNHRARRRVPLSFLVLTLVGLAGCSGQQPRPANTRISATISGLRGTGLVTQTNGANSVSVTANGPIVLAYIASGTPYDVTVKEQPHDPTQSCTVTGGSGTVGKSDVSNVSIVCTGGAYDVNASVSGLLGQGLVLRENFSGSAPVAVTTNGTVTLASQITDGSPYSVLVDAQPPSFSQTCSVVSPGTGKLAGANVTVEVTCVTSNSSFERISATVSGLRGKGLVIQTNGANDVSATTNGSVELAYVASGARYDVTIKQQPTSPAQNCVLSNGSGTVSGAYVTDIVIACTGGAYDITASVSNLLGQGLVLKESISGSTVAVTQDGTVTVAPQDTDGSEYSVDVTSQPINPSQTCTVSPPTGKLSGSNASLTVTCLTKSFSVRGTIIGYTGSGLVLDETTKLGTLPIAAMTKSFAFSGTLSSGSSYSVRVSTPPTSGGIACSVINGSSTVANSDVYVAVLCRSTVAASAGFAHSSALRADGSLWSSPLLCVNRTLREAPRVNHAAWATATSFDFSRDISR